MHPSSKARNADLPRWLDWFNRSRQHSALKGFSPLSAVNKPDENPQLGEPYLSLAFPDRQGIANQWPRGEVSVWLVVEAANSTSMATPRDQLSAPIDIPLCGREHHNLKTRNVAWVERPLPHLFGVCQTRKPCVVILDLTNNYSSF